MTPNAITLPIARRLAVRPLPMGSATTWCTCHGYQVHASLDDAARRINECELTNQGARILSVADDAGLSVADEQAALERARAGIVRATSVAMR